MRAQSMAERNSMQGTRYDRTRDGGRAGPLQVALLVPCHNEAATVAAVVAGFRASLPAADCHVFDNRSDDGTGDCLHGLPVTVLRHPRRLGKGAAAQLAQQQRLCGPHHGGIQHAYQRQTASARVIHPAERRSANSNQAPVPGTCPTKVPSGAQKALRPALAKPPDGAAWFANNTPMPWSAACCLASAASSG